MSKDHVMLECNNYQFHDLTSIVAKYETKKATTVTVDKVALGALLRDHGRIFRKLREMNVTVNEDPTLAIVEEEVNA